MKTVLLLTGLVALALGVAVPHHDPKLKPVDAEFVSKQKKVLSLFEHVDENDQTAECYKVGVKYNIEANIDKYTNKKAVEEFLNQYKAVDADFVFKQKKVLSLFESIDENDHSADCHKAGLNYDIEANIDKYT
ncbi:unnamed protein product, partial [Arctia plantaginis]